MTDFISQLTDEELVNLIEVQFNDYTEEALNFAKSEAEKRGGLSRLKSKIEEERYTEEQKELFERHSKEIKEQTANEYLAETQGIYKFKTLLAYGKFFSGFGWIVVVLGIILVVVGIGLTAAESIGIGLSLLGGAVFLILIGLLIVVSGQLISCFVEIEKNTRMTYSALSKKQDNK